MYIDCVYEVVYTFILMVYMGGIYMYIDCVYEVVYTCILIVSMRWYIHVY